MHWQHSPVPPGPTGEAVSGLGAHCRVRGWRWGCCRYIQGNRLTRCRYKKKKNPVLKNIGSNFLNSVWTTQNIPLALSCPWRPFCSNCYNFFRPGAQSTPSTGEKPRTETDSAEYRGRKAARFGGRGFFLFFLKVCSDLCSSNNGGRKTHLVPQENLFYQNLIATALLRASPQLQSPNWGASCQSAG